MNVVRHPASEALFLIRTITAVRPKMKIRTRVSDGEFGSEVLSQKIFTEGNKANEDSD